MHAYIAPRLRHVNRFVDKCYKSEKLKHQIPSKPKTELVSLTSNCVRDLLYIFKEEKILPTESNQKIKLV